MDIVKDKNGLELCEGDVIDISPEIVNGERYFVITFDTANNIVLKRLNGEWIKDFNNFSGFKVSYIGKSVRQINAIVCGNIYKKEPLIEKLCLLNEALNE